VAQGLKSSYRSSPDTQAFLKVSAQDMIASFSLAKAYRQVQFWEGTTKGHGYKGKNL
jgi:hypothetical protein